MQRVAGASRPRRRGPSGGLAMLLVALLALAAVHTAAAMGVVGIDYGTESTKISLVKPGMPFDVVLSRDSKRKVPSAVAWKMQERLHGSDATSLATRFPGDTFVAAKLLMGRSFDDANAPARERVAGLLNTELFASQRGTCEARRATDYTTDKSGADTYTVEELVGAQLSHARTLAEETAGEEFRRSYPGSVGNFGGLDVVITVPVFWTAAERQSMMDAAEIAGFKPRLVSDGAAVGVNYAQSRTFATPERHLFYDAGAGSTRATIVEFSTKTVQAESVISIGSMQKEAVVVDVLSAGWNREASGLALDLLIRDVLADKFTEGHAAKLSKPVREQPRAMARLLKEANRVKHILSANAEASVNIEGLADDIDFRSRLSREDFEALVEKAGLTSAFGEPVAEALRNAKMKIGDLTSVVLVGGMSRVPLVQAALRAAGVPDSKVAQNVNADEAAVMGAAFYGAEFNPQFRMKSIRAHDGNAYPVVLREKGGKDEVIFPQGPFLQERHERKYKDVHEDFSFEVAYAPSSKSKLDTFAPELYRIELVEIHNHLAGLKERGEIEQVDIDLNVTLVTQPLGIYSVESAWLNVKQKPTSIAGALRSFFNVGAQRVDDDEDDDAVEVIPDATESEAANASEPTVVVNATDDKNATAAAKPKKAKKPTPTDRSIRIVGRAVSVGSNRPMSGSELKTAKDRLYVANVEMRRRAAKEEARNVLEAYIYRARDIVHDENFGAASKRKERDDIAAKAEELSEWLNEREAELAPTDKLKSKLASLQALVSPVEKRMAEQSGRGAAVRRFTKALEETRAFVVQARANLSEALAAGTGSKYSTAELDTLNGNVERDDKWYREGEAKQARKKADEDPVFKVDELDKRVKKLRDTVKRLASRRIPKTRPPKKSKEAKSSSSATSESATASPAASDAPPKHEEL